MLTREEWTGIPDETNDKSHEDALVQATTDLITTFYQDDPQGIKNLVKWLDESGHSLDDIGRA